MKVTKLFLIALLTASLTISLLAGCSSGNNNDETSQTKNTAGSKKEETQEVRQKEAKLTAWIFEQFAGFGDYFPEVVVPEFQQQFPGVTIKSELLPWDGGPDKVVVAIAAGETPDIHIDAAARMRSHMAKNVLLPINNSLNDRVVEAMQGVMTMDDKIYGIPLGLSPYVINVNMSLVREYGLEDMLPADYSNWTLKDFRDFIAAATEKGERKGVFGTSLFAGSQSSDTATINLLMSNGAKMWDNEKNEFVINSSKGVKALEMLVNMVNEGIITPGAPTLTDADQQTLYFTKKNFIYWCGTYGTTRYVYDKVKEGELEEPLESVVFQFPKAIDGTRYNIAGWLPTVIGGFDNKNADKAGITEEFIDFFTSHQEILQTYFSKRGTIPVIKGLNIGLDSEFLTGQYAKTQDWVAYTDLDWGVQFTWWQEIRGIFYQEIQAAYAGAKTAQQALDDFVKQANEIAENNLD